MKHPYIILLSLIIPTVSSAAEGTQPIQPYGDIRFRQESIDVENQKNRTRQRVRARLGLKSQVDAMTKLELRLSTGLGDPISGNQTLDDNASTKPIGLDLAYFQISAFDATFGGGKVKNPFDRMGGSQLVFDSDWNPEGLHLGYGYKNDAFDVAFTAGNFWLDERSGTSEDATLTGAQLKLHANFGSFGLQVSGASYNFQNTKEYGVLDASAGNTTEAEPTTDGSDPEETYKYEYSLTNYAIGISASVGIPVLLFYDAVQNPDPEEDNAGSWIGIILGDGKYDKTRWKLHLTSMQVEADAVLGSISDSDSYGGGTNGKGARVGASYATSKNMTAGFTYFDQVTPIEDGLKYQRGQVDLSFTF